jgi:hypothetical protein
MTDNFSRHAPHMRDEDPPRGAGFVALMAGIVFACGAFLGWIASRAFGL